MTVHNFADDLAYAHELEDAPWWDEVYRKAFGKSLKTHTRHPQDGWHQRAGIDRLVILNDSTVLRIDEKVRRRAYADILLETESKFYGVEHPRNVPGWAVKDSATDYIAYAFEPTRTCYLLPFQLLRSALRANYPAWWEWAEVSRNGFRFTHAQNDGYVTRCLAVPIPTLMSAMSDAIQVRWS